ncbi:beta-ketoacyl-[acyl-carrier-protein] synthase III 1-like [Ylistrum balloti]|uniref:beta-ketoacyl-[acyl-carrier-protein] synthase III 1-like n=1 Tax=Ylistrum balloti TaxID=509963 RepID=UPI0029057FB7|nr:beta-ketoacyl-[acyl-carrier-protein] synthase III 1-like [Ylistrum balloti]
MNVEITSVGSFIPSKIIDNKELYQKISNFELEKAKESLLKKNFDVTYSSDEEIFDTWVRQVCGIISRPFISEEDEIHDLGKEKKIFVELMAAEASKKAISSAGIDPDSIDQIIFSTYSSSRTMPSPATTLKSLLNLKRASAVTMNGACSGFLDALIDAAIKVESKHFETILVVASENLSDKMDFNDPKSSIIFSDGSGACIIQKSKQQGVLGFASGVTFSEQVYMERTGNIFFNSGPLVERNAVNTMHGIAVKTLKNSQQSFEDIQYIVPHQANLRILMSFEKKIQTPNTVILKQIERLGNLSSASIPVTLDCFLREFKEKKEKLHLTENHSKDYSNLEYLNFLFISVGGGYTYSALSTKIKNP